MGFRGNKAKEVQTHPFPWSLSEMTHFCSSASFQNRDCFSESTAFVAGPITGVVLFIIHSFCLGCICLRQNSSALKATVRAEIALQIGEIKFSRFRRWRILSFFLFFFSLKFVANCSTWLIAVHPAMKLSVAQRHPTDLLVLFLFFELLFQKIDAQVSKLLTKKSLNFLLTCASSQSLSWCQYSYSYLFSV